MIKLLSKETIDKIAAGEVVERPLNVCKELLDNAVDSGATSITIEIRGGGTELIRVTDNGCGIEKEDLKNAFVRHATSKITEAEDLFTLTTMGFRGEALSSIAGVSRVELITKSKKSLTGYRYLIEGGKEISLREIGVPDGTTMIVRDLFYNVPVRRDFLKSAKTEGSYVRDIAEKFALSFPAISFSFLMDGKQIFHTSGNGRLKDVIYVIYGPEITAELLPIEAEEDGISLKGFLSKPVLSRSRRDYEIYFVNSRFVRSSVLDRAIETAYEGYLMQHRFPFTVLKIDIDPAKIDVNIHPQKTEIRFSEDEKIFNFVYEKILYALRHREHIVELRNEITGAKKEEQKPKEHIEPFEEKKAAKTSVGVPELSSLSKEVEKILEKTEPAVAEAPPESETIRESVFTETNTAKEPLKKASKLCDFVEPSFFLSKEAKPYYRFIGQVFDTYWIIEYKNEMYIIDQHAAHEKVNYEHFMKQILSEEVTSQMILPKMITVSAKEAVLLNDSLDAFNEIGYDIESAGDKDFIVRAVPASLPEISETELLMEMIANLSNEKPTLDQRILKEKIASMSCKAAVKGQNKLSEEEMRALIDELLTLEDPYNCPHGRPCIVRYTRYEMDKMFKRIV